MGLKGHPPIIIIDGELEAKVNVKKSFWSLEDKRTFVLHLEKINKVTWWPRFLITDPEINTENMQP